ncbi:MAG: HD domain-containing protein [Nitrososphaeraceae archaeon]
MMKYKIHDSTKLYFTKLLKFYENSIENVVRITKVFSIANVIHSGKFYDDIKSEPYINHPLRVALILAGELNITNIDLICTAILHDIYEKKYSNSSFDEKHLKQNINKNIYDIISKFPNYKIEVNYNDSHNDGSNNKIDESIIKFQNLMSKTPKEIKYLILSDRLDTVRILKKSKRKDKIQRYKNETQKYFVPLADKTDDKFVFKLSVALYELK